MGFVSVTERDGVTVVAADRPPVNAVDPVLIRELVDAADAVRESQAPAIVLAGRPGSFSAGADLKLVPQLDQEGQAGMVRGINALVAAWYPMPAPVVGALTGHAIAGGL